VDDADRVRWAKTLTTAGWLFLLAYLGVLAGLIRRAFSIEPSSFDDGAWGLRIETIAFAAIPQNIVILVPAAAAASAGVLIGKTLINAREMWLAQLVRATAGLSYVLVLISSIRLIAIITDNPGGVGDFRSILAHLGGIAIALAMARVCLESERSFTSQT
jgi:hypothetical protein